MEIPLLDGSNKPADKDSFSTLSDETKAKLAELAEKTETVLDKTKVATAFVIFKTLDGTWMANFDLSMADQVEKDHDVTEEEMWHAAAAIKRDIEIQRSAVQTQAVFMQTAQAIQQQQANQQIAQQLQQQLAKKPIR